MFIKIKDTNVELIVNHIYIQSHQTSGHSEYYKMYVRYVGTDRFEDMEYIDNPNDKAICDEYWSSDIFTKLESENHIEYAGPPENFPELFV